MAEETGPSLDDEGTGRTFSEVAAAYNQALDNLKRASNELDKANLSPDEYTDEQIEKLTQEAIAADGQAKRLNLELSSRELRDRSREQYKKIPLQSGTIMTVNEPDMYVKDGRSFFSDLYLAEIRNQPEARDRISRHHQHEVEKRATTSATLGGIIPPAYLVGLYAKASRNGRVYADQANGAPLPDVGMSIVVPRITTATAAGVQATENTALTSQDPVETDLTVNVRTLGGYL